MRVQFVLGKPGAGRTSFCYREIAEAQADTGDAPLILVVPEQGSFQSEKALLGWTGGVLSRARVLSFDRLSYFVLGKTGGVGRIILENSGKNMVLRKIVAGLLDELQYFRTARDSRGFLDGLAASITEFYNYDICPDQLEARATAASESPLGMKLSDISLIYAKYREFMESSYISNDEVLDILAEKIPQSDFLAGARIWIDGFKSFTPQEIKVISALIQRTNQVKITLASPKDAADFSDLSRLGLYNEVVQTMQDISKIVVQIGAKMEKPIILDHSRHEHTPELAFLCENYLGFSAQKIYAESPKNIQIYRAASIFDEIDFAARMTATLTHDRGYKYSEIGIVATDLPRYDKFLPAIFGSYGIPVFVDVRRSILGHPIAQMVLTACRIIHTNWSYEAVFNYLRLPVFENQDEIDLLENYVLAYNIRGKSWQEDFKFGKDEDLERLNEIRQKAVETMDVLASSFTPRKKFPLKDFAHRIYEFLMKNGAPDALEKWADSAGLRGDNQRLREHEQIWDAIMGTLSKMVEILPEHKESVGGFAKIFEAGLPDLGLAPPSLDQLVMGDMRRTRFGTIKALIILGAKDGALPARPADAGLLSDDDRAALASGGLKLAMDSTAKINEEEFLIYANISKPTEFLAISFPAGDLEGKGANPARLVNRVRELFPELGVPLPLISNKHKAFTDLTLALGKRAASGAKVEPHLLDAYAYFAKDEEFSQKIAAMKGGLEFSNANHALKKLGKRDIRTSVTRLQKYISCPFAYFAEFNLHAKKRKIHEVGALDMGNIYHDILSKFGEALKSLDAADAADEGKVADIISASVDAVFDDPSNEKLGSSGRYKHFASKMRLISQRSADALAKHLSDGKFSLTYNEVAFGVPQKDADYYLPPIEIELSDNAKMLLEGRIDRVDVGKLGGADYVKIIDYKSGRKQFSLEEVYYGLDMQLLVYLGAFVSQIATNRGEAAALKILPAAAFYFNLLNPLLDFDNKLTDPNTYKKKVLDTFKMSGIVLDDDEVQTAISQNADSYKKSSAQVPADTFARLLDHVMHLAKSAGEDILAGFIPISPYKHRANSPCTHCDYHPICKFDDTTGQRTARPLKALTREEIINSLS